VWFKPNQLEEFIPMKYRELYGTMEVRDGRVTLIEKAKMEKDKSE
jgi:hypothetical protein